MSTVILLWVCSLLRMTVIPSHVLRLVLLPNVWFVLQNVPCVLEKTLRCCWPRAVHTHAGQGGLSCVPTPAFPRWPPPSSSAPQGECVTEGPRYCAFFIRLSVSELLDGKILNWLSR